MPSSSTSSDLVERYLQDYLQDQGRRVHLFEEVELPEPPSLYRSLRARVTTGSLVAALIVVSLLVWATPPVKHWGPGPSPEQVAYERELARANDLKRQLDDLQSNPDARAEDLKRQVEELEAKLGIPRPDDQSARAEDLKTRLDRAEEVLKQPRPPVTDPVAAARAEDLARQNAALNAKVTAPRPPIDPLANVNASLTKAQIVAGKKMFGLYTEQAPFNYAEVNQIQGQVNRKANIVGYFQNWTNGFRPDAVKQTWSRGQIPLLTWESQPQVGNITANVPEYNLPSIIGGQHDDYIRKYARDIANLGLPLILRFDHEMNGTWYPWSENVNGNGEGDYARMWRHVHDIFEQEGANALVAWLWAPNRINAIPNRPAPKAFYPGDAYVDLIGMSGYYRPYDSGPYFSETNGKTLPLLREAAPGKPIFLAEIGATELNGQKALWIKSMFDNLTHNPDIVAFVWFSLTVTAKHEGQTQTNDWRVNSSPSAINAMGDGLAGAGWGLPNG